MAADIVDLVCKYEGAQYEKVCDEYVQIKVMLGSDHTVWTGGSAMAMDKKFEQKWITKEKYEEEGPTIIDQKQ